MKLFQTTVRFLGHHIFKGTVKPIDRATQFASEFPNEISDKKKLQRILGSLNYIRNFYQNLAKGGRPLYTRLRKNLSPWTPECTKAVQKLKLKATELPCLALVHPNKFAGGEFC